ncbi:MAG: formate dehydrogenase, partial [Cellvibrionales bacterium]|nr:formate dehydrogenase [Cellvibrionales bacterium]
LGKVDLLTYLSRQQRWIYERVGIIDPLDPEDFQRHGGLAGLKAAMAMAPADVLEAVKTSGLRGRGGAGFPAGIKWQTVADQEPAPLRGQPSRATRHKFICVNADEGDSGTFADRMLMEGDPFSLLEGMAIAAYAVGADRGMIYLRSEYPEAWDILCSAIEVARSEGWLGESVLGSNFAFDVEVRLGAGSYVCGEEASVPGILARGAEAYAGLGCERSRGTQVFQLAGNIAQGGIVEMAFGVSARELVEDFGGGTLSGRPVKAVQIGGPLGAYIPPDQLDVPMAYEALADAGAMLGHGGLVVFDDSADMAEQARFAMEFCAEESCGKCTPCRIGAVRGMEVIDRLRQGDNIETQTLLLRDLCDVMKQGSLCAMGGLTPNPVLSALDHFAEDFR